MLDNEIYTGRVFYGKTSQYLKADKRRIPRDEWLQVTTFPPIVSDQVYRKVRARMDRPINLTDEELLDRLRRCLREHGKISTPLITAMPYLPSQQAIRRRFGKLKHAFALVGYVPGPGHWQARNGRREEDVLEGLRRLHARHGYLSGDLISAAPDLPSLNYLRLHFGSLRGAYERIGLHLSRGELNRASARRAGKGLGLPKVPMPRKKPVRKNAKGRRFTLGELKAMLRRLLREYGYLSERVIQGDPAIPTFNYFRTRFGSIFAAYEAVGYHANFADISRAAQQRANEERKRRRAVVLTKAATPLSERDL